MSPRQKRLYFACLYCLLALLIVANVFLAIAGSSVAPWSIALQCVVLIAAVHRKSWSKYVIYIWAGIGILSAAAKWIAVLLRGFPDPIGMFAFSTVMACVLFALLAYTEDAFAPAAKSSEPGPVVGV